MRDKYSRPHADIARAIRLAKKRMFKNHRNGYSLREAGNEFWSEVSLAIPDDGESLTTREVDPLDARADTPDHTAPLDVSVETIAQHMAENPEWEKQLLTARQQFNDDDDAGDPLNLRARARAIIEDNAYPDSTRDALIEALDEIKPDVEMILDMVTIAEGQGRKRKVKPVPLESTDTPAPLLSDEQISELTGRLQRSVDNSLREMAEAIRGGECPGEAWQKVMSTFLDNSNIIPRREYDGMTHRQWWGDKHERSQAIINDDSGRYAASTKAAIALVRKEMKTPGNESTTDLGWRDYGDWIKRAESGEALDLAVLIPGEHTADLGATEATDEQETASTELTEPEIKCLVAAILQGGDVPTEQRGAALLLLFDEFRATGDAVYTAERAAFVESYLADQERQNYVDALRDEFAGGAELPRNPINAFVEAFKAVTNGGDEE